MFHIRVYKPKRLMLLGLLFVSQVINYGALLPSTDERAKTYRVRTGTGLGPEEINALHMRLPNVKRSIEQLLGTTISSKATPFIGLASSGGGFRSMIATTGFMRGLQKIGVLDSSMYFSTLSGSTWMSSSWLSQNLSLDDFRTFLRKKVSRNVFKANFDIAAIAKDIETKIYYGQHVSLVDVYGAMLGHFLFGNIVPDGQKVYLSQLAPKISTGNYPIPVYTSVLDYGSGASFDWFEFSPYEAGCQKLKAWVPMAAFGKKFDAGVSTDQAPEPTFGFLMGICGSAFAANIKEILQELETVIFKNMALALTKEFRISPAQVFNFTKNIATSGFSDETYYTLVDGGLDFNIPLPPLLRRPTDIIIICDASSDITDNEAPGLHGAENYAQQEDIPFPPINYTGIGKKPVSVFQDNKDADAPIIIYFPSQVAFSTLKFDYSGAEFDKLSDTIEKTVIANKALIVNAIKAKAAAMRNSSKRNHIC